MKDMGDVLEKMSLRARIYAVVMHVAGRFVTIWCSYVSGGHETAELVCDASLR